MAGSYFSRIFNYVVNQWLVDGLANSVKFQRFAVRSSKKFDEVVQKGKKKRDEVSELFRNFSSGGRDKSGKRIRDD